MAFSYTLKDWMKLSEDAISLGAEFFQLVKTIINMLRQGITFSRDLWNLGNEILFLAQDMLRNPKNRPAFLSNMLSNLMKKFVAKAKR